jgi:hypothetical protein
MGESFNRIRLKPVVILPVIVIVFILIILGFAFIPEETRMVLCFIALLIIAAIPVVIAIRIRREQVKTTFSKDGAKRIAILLVGLFACALLSAVIISALFHEAVPAVRDALCPVGFSSSSPEVAEREYERRDTRTNIATRYVQEETCLVCATERYEFKVDSLTVIMGMIFIHISITLLTVIVGAITALLVNPERPRLKAAIPVAFFLLASGLLLVPSPVSSVLQGVYRSFFYGGSTPLFYRAVSDNNTKLLDGLLARGASINSIRNGETPLVYAVRKSRTEMATALLERGANPDITDAEGWTPLMRSVEARDTAMVDILLKHEADVNAKNPDGETALALARKAGKQEVIDLILRSEPRER